MPKQLLLLIGTLFFFLIINSCKNNNKETLLGSICDTTDTKFATVINPIIIANCNTQSGCHGTFPMGSISLEGYTNIKNNYTSILSRINDGNMPKNASKLDNCTIIKIQTWVNKGAQNN